MSSLKNLAVFLEQIMSSNKLYFKTISIFVSFLLVLIPTHCFADAPRVPPVVESSGSDTSILDKGRVRSMNRGQRAPYSGVLLDSTAAAKIIVDRKYSELRFNLKLDLELKKLTTDYELQVGNLKTQLDSTNKRTESIILAKTEEINRLQDIIKEQPADHSHWFAVGGFVLGALVSIGIFYAAAEASK